MISKMLHYHFQNDYFKMTILNGHLKKTILKGVNTKKVLKVIKQYCFFTRIFYIR